MNPPHQRSVMMNSSGNSKALALKFFDLPIDPRQLTTERRFDTWRRPFTTRDATDMATAFSSLAGDSAVDTGQQLKAENFRGGLHVIWCGNTGAHYGLQTIPNPMNPSREKLRMSKKKIPKLKNAALPRWAERIIAARSKLKMTQIAFAEALQTTQSNVSKWERGEYRPSPDGFVKIAGLCNGLDKFYFLEEAGVPSEFFMGTAEKKMPSELVRATTRVIAESFAPGSQKATKTAEMVLIPLVSETVACGDPRTIEPEEIEKYLPCPAEVLPAAGNVLAFRVAGDSMAPIIDKGHIAFLDVSKRDPKSLIDKIVAVREKDSLSIMWLRKDLGHYILAAQNPATKQNAMRVLTPSLEQSIVGEVATWIGRKT